MVVPSAAQLQAFAGGQMTDLPEYPGGFDPTALIEVVSPGNVEEGVNYAMSLLEMASIIVGSITVPTIITVGATIGTPYVALISDTRVLLNKAIASASYVNIGGGAARSYIPLMVRDLKGDAATNNITVSFTGTCDGMASPIVINAAYGGWVFNPLSDGNWYLTST